MLSEKWLQATRSWLRRSTRNLAFFWFFYVRVYPEDTRNTLHCFFSFFVTSPGELGGLLRGARAHHDDRRTLEVPGCSSALCLRFYCCRGRARPVSSGCCAAGAAVCGLLACCVRLSITPSRHRAGRLHCRDMPSCPVFREPFPRRRGAGLPERFVWRTLPWFSNLRRRCYRACRARVGAFEFPDRTRMAVVLE